MGVLCDPMAWTTDAGDIPACIEVKLVDFPDAGYYSTNKPHPQGEIWIRGESVPGSYFKSEKDTAEGMAPDGWFRTGDIGEWDKNGHLKIIDRKKNLVKTLNGEYIALEKVHRMIVVSRALLISTARIRVPLGNNCCKYLCVRIDRRG
jgi:long-chain acyl-CoA synthetase